MASATAELASRHSNGASTWPAKAWRDRLELAAQGLLVVLFLLGLVVRSDALPMHVWDESRNANNALGAALHGHWLTPTYNGVVDHWNTKPPLLIWMVASAMSVGLPPLWALRLPSVLAAAGTLSLIWAALRFGLRDRLAALIAVSLVLSSALYTGLHGARTGDFDCLETFFLVGYVLSFWRVLLDPARTAWFVAFAACVVGAVLTKGIAGLLPAPGLLLCLAANPKRALRLARDWRSWVFSGSAALACLAYYGTRELYDPGYIAAVLDNEVGGRFLKAMGGRTNDVLFYLKHALALEPVLFLLPFGLIALRRRDEARNDLELFFAGALPHRQTGPTLAGSALALVALAAGASLFLVISSAQTKLTWYALPLIPLLSIPSALGASEGLRWAFAGSSRPMRVAAAAACVCLVVILPAAQAVQGFSLPDHYRPKGRIPVGARQLFYGRAISALRREGFRRPVAVVDSGFKGGPAEERNYNPILDFYLALNARDGRFSRVRPPQPLAPASTVLTCDPKSFSWLAEIYTLSPARDVEGCYLVTIVRRRS